MFYPTESRVATVLEFRKTEAIRHEEPPELLLGGTGECIPTTWPTEGEASLNPHINPRGE